MADSMAEDANMPCPLSKEPLQVDSEISCVVVLGEQRMIVGVLLSVWPYSCLDSQHAQSMPQFVLGIGGTQEVVPLLIAEVALAISLAARVDADGMCAGSSLGHLEPYVLLYDCEHPGYHEVPALAST